MKVSIKKIGLALICIAFSLTGICQPAESKFFDISMPPGTSKLTKQQLSDYMHSNFKRNKIPIDSRNLNVTDYYKKDGLIISFWDFEFDPSYRRRLEDIGAGIMGLLKRNRDTVNLYRIVKINDSKFLEYEYQQEDEIFLWFQSDANSKNQYLCGVIQCKKPDEAKAENYLQELLQSVHFK